MEIATEHAEAVRQRARVGVKERLLLDRIALYATDVTPRHEEAAAAVESHLAHAHRTVGNGALVAAGMAAQAAAIERFDELWRSVARALGEQFLQLHLESVRQNVVSGFSRTRSSVRLQPDQEWCRLQPD